MTLDAYLVKFFDFYGLVVGSAGLIVVGIFLSLMITIPMALIILRIAPERERKIEINGSKDILKIIYSLNPGRTFENISSRLHKATEEVGEVAGAYLQVRSKKNPKGKTGDDVREEAVDTAIMGLDIAFSPMPGEETLTEEQLINKTLDMFELKLGKWNRQVENDEVVTQ